MFLSIGLTGLSVKNVFASENSILPFTGVSSSPIGSVLYGCLFLGFMIQL